MTVNVFLDSSGDRVSLLCVDKHPTQPHLLAAGGQDGVLSIWDMRQELYPVTLLEAHAAESKSKAVFYFMFNTICDQCTTYRLLVDSYAPLKTMNRCY